MFGRAHDLAPGMGEALWGMAEARLRQSGSAQEPVVDWLHRAAKLAPTFAPGKTTLGQYHFTRTWKFQETESAFEQALELDRENSQAHFLYAQFLLARDQFYLALQHTREYMALAPENYAIPVEAWIDSANRHSRLLISSVIYISFGWPLQWKTAGHRPWDLRGSGRDAVPVQ